GFMLRYNDSRSVGFPFNTANVPVIESERGFAHPVSIADQEDPQQMNLPVIVSFNSAIISQGVAVGDGAQPVWSNSPEELMAQGTRLSPQGSAALIDGGQALEITSAASTYDEQFASAPIDVEKNTDYVLVLPVRLALGDMAIRVTSADRRITLASAILSTA